jgi:FixJ family two-component response regulator
MRNDSNTEVTLYIVDNEVEVRNSMVGLFGTGCGFRVQAFSSGEEFLQRVNIQKPDCVLLDRRMDGGMSGLQVHEALIAKATMNKSHLAHDLHASM